MTIYEELRVTDKEPYEFIYSLYDGNTPYVLQTGEALKMYAFGGNWDDLFTVTATATQTAGNYQFILPVSDINKLPTYQLGWYKVVLVRNNGDMETCEQMSPLIKVR